jgi:hypothetical protein
MTSIDGKFFITVQNILVTSFNKKLETFFSKKGKQIQKRHRIFSELTRREAHYSANLIHTQKYLMSCLAPILNMNGQKESPGAQNTPLT